MTDLSEARASFVRELGEAARNNPISAALIGMGVLWMFGGGEAVKRAGAALAGSGRDAGRETWPSIRSSAKSGTDSMGSGIRSAAQNVGERASSALNRVSEFGRKQADSMGSGISSAAQNIGDSTTSALDNVSDFGRKQTGTISEYAKSIPSIGDAFETVRSSLTEAFRAQPLTLGAIGLAVGAGIAAALPVSELESAYLGEASDAVRKKAADVASEQASRASDVAENIVEAASEEARKQGLTAEGARAAAGDLSAKLNRIADAGTQRFSRTIQT